MNAFHDGKDVFALFLTRSPQGVDTDQLSPTALIRSLELLQIHSSGTQNLIGLL